MKSPTENHGQITLPAVQARPAFPKQSSKADVDGSAKPFLKWVGGKRRLMPELLKRLPSEYERYYEPFVGGGALFFELKTNKATLTDTNPQLIITYRVIRDQIDELIAQLLIHQSRHNTVYYYDVRARHDTSDPVEVAARMIYLNKTCFNGLYRVNRQGLFNVPVGRYANPAICDEAALLKAHQALQNVCIERVDFQDIQPGPNDFVYFDPPYEPVSATSFVTYSKTGFSRKDQVALANLCDELHRQGTQIMISNSLTPFTRKLYKKPGFRMSLVKAPRTVGSTASSRQPASEIIVTNY